MTADRRNPTVDTFLDEKAHPMRAEIDRLRQVVLSADERIDEAVKWGGPTFVLAGGRANLATITLRGRSAVTLFFQEGASLPDQHGLLSGDAAHVRTTRFESLADIDEAADALGEIVRTFCDANGGTIGGGGRDA
jgi:hypothetical protein